MISVYITCKDKKEAKKIAKKLLEKRLAGCCNIFPIESLYRWKGKIVSDKEQILIAKTIKKNLKILKVEVKRLHSYDVPCILSFKEEANKEYSDWIKKELK